MRKFKLELHDLRIDSFTTTPMAREKGTVFGEQECTCPTACTCPPTACSCPGCPTCDATCDDTCDWTCGYTCGTCGATGCELSCFEGHTCCATCGPNATDVNTPCAEC